MNEQTDVIYVRYIAPEKRKDAIEKIINHIASLSDISMEDYLADEDEFFVTCPLLNLPHLIAFPFLLSDDLSSFFESITVDGRTRGAIKVVWGVGDANPDFPVCADEFQEYV